MIPRAFTVAAIMFTAGAACEAADPVPTESLTPELAKLIVQLQSKDYTVHREAEAKINQMGASGIRAVPHLMTAAVTHKHKKGKVSAGHKMRMAVIKAGGPIDVLEEFTTHTDPDVRDWSYEVLASLGPKSQPVLPRLMANLRSDDGLAHTGAIKVIGAIGPAAQKALPLLIRLFERPTQWSDAVAAVVRIGPVAAEPLVEVLKSEIPACRRAAARCIGSYGKLAGSVIEYLDPLLEDKNAAVRVAAAEAIWKCGGKLELVLPTLRQGLLTDAVAADDALRCLAVVGVEAEPAVPELVSFVALKVEQRPLAARDFDRGQTALKLLGVIGPKASDAVPLLVDLLEHHDGSIRVTAAHTLYRIEGKAERALDVLTRLTNWVPTTENELERKRLARIVQIRAVRALGQLGSDAEPAIPLLVELMFQPSTTVAYYCAQSLAQIGPRAVPALNQALQRIEEVEKASQKRALRRHIERALKNLQESRAIQ